MKDVKLVLEEEIQIIINVKYLMKIYITLYIISEQWITENEAEKKYFNEEDNTYKPCYKRCVTCSDIKKCITIDENDQDGKYINNGELKYCYSFYRKCKGVGTWEKIIVLNVLIIIIFIINTT